MPIPTPRSGETESAYVSRCMGMIGGEYDDPDQALAICYDEYRRKKADRDNDAVLELMEPTTGTQGDLEKIQEIEEIGEDNPVRLSTDTFAGVGNYAEPSGVIAGRYPEVEIDEDVRLPRHPREEANDLDKLFPIE